MPEGPQRGRAEILFVWGRATGVGGTETRMAESVGELCRRDVRVTSVFLTEPRTTELSTLLHEAGSHLEYAGSSRKLASILRASRTSSAMVFGLRASLKLRFVSAVARRRLRILDARNGLEAGRSKALWMIDRLTQRRVHSYIANSDAVRGKLLEHGIDDSRVRVVKSALGQQWESKASVPRHSRRIAMIGNDRPEKNQRLGLEVASRLGADVEMRVFTDDAAALRSHWESIRGDNHADVTFVEGHRVTPQDLASCTLLLHPSVSESAPRVLLEAQSQGTPVVATDVGDTRRMVGEAGLVVPVADVEATLAAVQQVLAWDEIPAAVPDQTLSSYCDALLDHAGVER